ncbi:hypothetical protein ACIRYZ_27740 [Kitasatospora sp. NPDC101155]|uniref:hypothetical protein n=1 Tax=Kitasatospora sp. NPDC101155 TaxID=3364097 RepID=UPI003802E6A6
MHGLSDPLRLRIVDLLARQGKTECSVIYNALGGSASRTPRTTSGCCASAA